MYARNAISALLQAGQKVDLIVRAEDWNSDKSQAIAWRDRVLVHYDDSSQYSFKSLLGLAKRIPFSDYDVYHCPHYTLPLGVPIPTIVTVHDIIHMSYPEHFYYPLIARPLINSALKRAAAVLTVSQSSADSLRANFSKINLSNRLFIVPNTVDLCFRNKKAVGTLNGKAKQEYFLTIFSNLKPHKGFDDLLDAYKFYLDNHFGQVNNLVLVGQGIEANLREVEAKIKKKGLQEAVTCLGSVSDLELSELYRGAKGLIVPSLEEGFYLPILEAHACGTPAVIRPVSAICEIKVAADIQAEDFSIVGLARALEQASLNFDSSCRRTILDDFNAQYLAKFSSVEIATALLEAYRFAIKSWGN